MKVRYFIFATALAISPLGALAQTQTPAVGAGDTKENATVKSATAANPHSPGSTGSTIVPGSTSTVSSDKPATTEQKTAVIGNK